MNVCVEMKRRIDEADQPNQPGLEISRHTAQCADCRKYSNDRAALRSLLGAGARVSAPTNFDALLNARIAGMKERKAFSWSGPAGYLRLGAATAALAVMVFAAESAHIFTGNTPALSAATASVPQSSPSAGRWMSREPNSEPRILTGSQALSAALETTIGGRNRSPRNAFAQAVRVERAPRTADRYVSLDVGDRILLREQNGERELTVRTVRVGAQSLVYTSRPSQPARSMPVLLQNF